jgi:hypothetical protein
MVNALLVVSAAKKSRALDFTRVPRDLLDFEEDYELANDEHEVRRAIERNGMIGTEALGLDLA